MQGGTERVTAIANTIMSKTGDYIDVAREKATASLNFAVDKQAYYLSYLDTFRLIAIFFLVVLPFILFLRTKKKSADEIAAAAKAVAEAH